MIDVCDAIRARKSTRSFLPDPVSRQLLERMLDTARWCGSFVNSQPWKFTVLGGPVMEAWKHQLWQAHCTGQAEPREYSIGPVPPPSPWGERGETFRTAIDNLMFPPGIDHWQERKDAYVRSGIIVRDAPSAVILHMDKELAQSPLHLLAAGGVTQAIALAAEGLGLGTCIMGKPVESPNLLRRLTGIPQSDLILCCIAVGYADPNGPINSLPRTRASVEELTVWHGF